MLILEILRAALRHGSPRIAAMAATCLLSKAEDGFPAVRFSGKDSWKGFADKEFCIQGFCVGFNRELFVMFRWVCLDGSVDFSVPYIRLAKGLRRDGRYIIPSTEKRPSLVVDPEMLQRAVELLSNWYQADAIYRRAQSKAILRTPSALRNLMDNAFLGDEWYSRYHNMKEPQMRERYHNGQAAVMQFAKLNSNALREMSYFERRAVVEAVFRLNEKCDRRIRKDWFGKPVYDMVMLDGQ